MASKTKAMCLVAMFSVLLMLGAWITIPTVPPFTMQTFVLYCMVWLLDGKKMLAAVILYLLLGVVGVPAFAGFQGGVGVLFGATGGYIFGFVVMALLRCFKPSPKSNTAFNVIVCIVGTLIFYALAVVWYAFLFTGMTAAGLWMALLTCVVPFVLPDIAKVFVAAFVGKRLKRYI